MKPSSGSGVAGGPPSAQTTLARRPWTSYTPPSAWPWKQASRSHRLHARRACPGRASTTFCPRKVAGTVSRGSVGNSPRGWAWNPLWHPHDRSERLPALLGASVWSGRTIRDTGGRDERRRLMQLVGRGRRDGEASVRRCGGARRLAELPVDGKGDSAARRSCRRLQLLGGLSGSRKDPSPHTASGPSSRSGRAAVVSSLHVAWVSGRDPHGVRVHDQPLKPAAVHARLVDGSSVDGLRSPCCRRSRAIERSQHLPHDHDVPTAQRVTFDNLMDAERRLSDLESRVARLERQMEELIRLLKRAEDDAVQRAARRARSA